MLSERVVAGLQGCATDLTPCHCDQRIVCALASSGNYREAWLTGGDGRHSVMAPVGRWQKNKDLFWYNKTSKDQQDQVLAEKRAIKEHEEQVRKPYWQKEVGCRWHIYASAERHASARDRRFLIEFVPCGMPASGRAGAPGTYNSMKPQVVTMLRAPGVALNGGLC